MIIIVDYQVGNLKSVQNAFQALGKETEITADLDKIKAAELLILPGQGAFATAMGNLKRLNLVEPINAHIAAQKPFLGICVGYQLLFEKSYEDGEHEGLGVFKGEVKRFESRTLKIPQMGWNTIDVQSDQNGYFKYISSNSYVYFVHSYYVTTTQNEIISAKTTYEQDYVSIVQAPNLLATQFHPEKSGDVGMSILKNFVEKIDGR